MTHEFLQLVTLTFSGIVIGAVIDWLQDVLALLRPTKKNRWIKAGIIVFAWAIFGVATFFLLWRLTFGEWRIYDPVAQFIGMMMYGYWFRDAVLIIRKILYLLVFRPIYFILHSLVYVIRQVVRAIFYIFWVFIWPIRSIWNKYFQKYLKKKAR
ncbi:spore cortex biosynthesis protein YabQ [Paenisporosarcina cavernae]|uniref:Spore cortex biosynthesis protein YabQ n=1 Tax=Paenisporosarcina cavernae TaxID=2320858 RepID=A0A385YV05_9BACL|nr:spore cortex biosynthesis protein YabQ [Paenisporosarcina cavernae]AYC30689.1 hypothetical protein D3873_13055 [Paenisporosarcina cavernae]